jgi:hypothetical protein
MLLLYLKINPSDVAEKLPAHEIYSLMTAMYHPGEIRLPNARSLRYRSQSPEVIHSK